MNWKYELYHCLIRILPHQVLIQSVCGKFCKSFWVEGEYNKTDLNIDMK